MNVADAAATVTMNAYNDDGEVITFETIALNAHEKRVGVASSFSSNVVLQQRINSLTLEQAYDAVEGSMLVWQFT